MARHFQVWREGNVFSAYCDTFGTPIFRVNGPEAAKAALRLLGVVTPIQEDFFSGASDQRRYNVRDNSGET